MSYVEENTERLMHTIMHEVRRLRTYYRSLIFCGILISITLFLTAYYFVGSIWGKIGIMWFGTSIFCGALWIYFGPYQKVKGLSTLAYLKRAFVNPYVLFFTAGFLIALLMAVNLQDDYENNLFSTLVQKVTADGKTVTEDSVFIRSVRTCYELLRDRSDIYKSQEETSWIGRNLHPLSSDLITADGACGSYANVLCRMLQALHYKTRMVQMKREDGQVCHIIVEALGSKGWVVLDPLYNLYFIRPDGRLASFDDVSHDWSRYRSQVPANYNTEYCYCGARYTNWSKIPVVMPALRIMLSCFMGKEDLDHFSMRTYFLRKYQVLEYIIIILLLLVSYRCLLLRKLKKTITPVL